MKKLLYTIFLSSCGFLFINAQVPVEEIEYENFYDTYNVRKTYYDSLHNIYPGDTLFPGEKKFYRWVRAWEPVVFPHGNIKQTISEFYEYLDWIEGDGGEGLLGTESINSIAVDWEEIGPVDPPENGGIPLEGKFSYTGIRGTGICMYVGVDPNNESRVFAGSPSGGLRYSENQGESWVSGGTNHLPVIGVSHFQMGRDQSEKEFWFIATGDGGSASGQRYHGNICETSIGIWRSEDQGNSWQDISQNSSGKIDLPSSGGWDLLIRKILIHPLNIVEMV